MLKPKKYLGQHFLKDKTIASDIVDAFNETGVETVLEIGPGTGVLTELLLKKPFETYVIEIDIDAYNYIEKNFAELSGRIINADFLHFNISEHFGNKDVSIIGNFPYNISSQILFKVLDFKEIIPEVVGMFQKEVAERIASKPGSKVYGILSVLMQAYYDIEYLFTVDEHVFFPPPKVKSAVIRLKRKEKITLNCDEVFFKRVVKMAFNQRRKTLRNSLKQLIGDLDSSNEIFNLRPEQLSVKEFVFLTNLINI